MSDKLITRTIRNGYSVTLPNNEVVEGPNTVELPEDVIPGLEFLLEPADAGDAPDATPKKARAKKDAAEPADAGDAVA